MFAEDGGALDRTWVALQRTDGSLERTGFAKRQDWRCIAKDWFALQRTGGALERHELHCRGLAVHWRGLAVHEI